ncbi:MAG: deoxyribonuclease I [Rubripirellula sp.]
MSESDGGNPIQVAVVVLLLVGGGWYFLRHYEIDGLDEISVSSKGDILGEETYITYRDAPSVLAPDSATGTSYLPAADSNPFEATPTTGKTREPISTAPVTRTIQNLKVASWALDGFGPTKLSNATARQNVARVIRQFDVIALQQIASVERDLVPRLVDAINHGDGRYDYVLGHPTGPQDRPEQLAFIFDTTRVHVDRRQTYTLADPDQQMTFDPLVAWFRAAEASPTEAWTFSFVNVRVDLARAPSEVALLPEIVKAIRNDGRGEDDLVLAGLFQADDAYLLPTIEGEKMRAAVRSRPTDIFGRYQTSNLLVETATTNEYVGRGGVYDYLRTFNLNIAEAETVTSQLPVYGEFVGTEGGRF